jgi:hypothetical protein
MFIIFVSVIKAKRCEKYVCDLENRHPFFCSKFKRFSKSLVYNENKIMHSLDNKAVEEETEQKSTLSKILYH